MLNAQSSTSKVRTGLSPVLKSRVFNYVNFSADLEPKNHYKCKWVESRVELGPGSQNEPNIRKKIPEPRLLKRPEAFL